MSKNRKIVIAIGMGFGAAAAVSAFGIDHPTVAHWFMAAAAGFTALGVNLPEDQQPPPPAPPKV